MISLAKAAKDYYLQKLHELSPREDYYLRGGTATGMWRGGGAAEVGLDGVVSTEGLVRLFDGLHPATGQQLGRRLRKDGVAAWDITFSADKSVSLLWAFGTPEIREQVMEAFAAATESALAYLESVASSTRGAERRPVLDDNGEPVLGEDGKPKLRTETWPIPTHGYLAASFTEFTSRENDPQLHTHVVVANRVKGLDGKWRAVDGQLLYRHQKDTSAIHEAELRCQLTERLGVQWQPVHKGMADIAGFTRRQIEEFSRRRQQIEAWVEAEGLTPSAAAYEAATLATRRAKTDHPVDTLMPEWQRRAAAVGITPEHIASIIGPSHDIQLPDIEELFTDMAAPEGLTKTRSTFGKGEVVEHIASALPEGGTRQQIEDRARQFLTTPDVVPILPTGSDRRRLGDIDGITDEQREILEQHLEPHAGTPPMRRGDRTFHPGLAHERRYTTAELLITEHTTITTALEGVGAGRFTPPVRLVEQAVADRPHLTDDQTRAVHHLTASGNAIDVAIGVAGSGKTTVMEAIRELSDATNTPIIGTALSGRAAAELQTDSGIPSYTITRLLGESQREGGLQHGTVLVVDEAGMVGTRQLARLAKLTEAAEGKLILTGDDHQLAEIDAGGLFTALANRLPSTQLTENIRQAEEWERRTLAELRHGSVARAVADYLQRSRVVIEATSSATLDRAVADWRTYVDITGDARGALLIAHHSATVDELNRRARDLTIAAGSIGGPGIEASGRVYQPGDRIMCLKNQSRIGVLNGDLGTVIAADSHHRTLTVSLDRHDETVHLPAWYIASGYLNHGYAITGHKAQGLTINRAFVVASDAITREWSYVAMSRGREATTIYLVSPAVDDDCGHITHNRPGETRRLDTALDRTERQTAAIDTGGRPQLTGHELPRRPDPLKNVSTRRPQETERRRDPVPAIADSSPAAAGTLTNVVGENEAKRIAAGRAAARRLELGTHDHAAGLTRGR